MPTYRNDTETRITFPDKHYISWQPGEAKALPFFVPHEDLGLTMSDPEPYVLRAGRAGSDTRSSSSSPARRRCTSYPMLF